MKLHSRRYLTLQEDFRLAFAYLGARSTQLHSQNPTEVANFVEMVDEFLGDAKSRLQDLRGLRSWRKDPAWTGIRPDSIYAEYCCGRHAAMKELHPKHCEVRKAREEAIRMGRDPEEASASHAKRFKKPCSACLKDKHNACSNKIRLPIIPNGKDATTSNKKGISTSNGTDSPANANDDGTFNLSRYKMQTSIEYDKWITKMNNVLAEAYMWSLKEYTKLLKWMVTTQVKAIEERAALTQNEENQKLKPAPLRIRKKTNYQAPTVEDASDTDEVSQRRTLPTAFSTTDDAGTIIEPVLCTEPVLSTDPTLSPETFLSADPVLSAEPVLATDTILPTEPVPPIQPIASPQSTPNIESATTTTGTQPATTTTNSYSAVSTMSTAISGLQLSDDELAHLQRYYTPYLNTPRIDERDNEELLRLGFTPSTTTTGQWVKNRFAGKKQGK